MKTPEVWMVCASQNIDNSSRTLPAWRARGYKTLVLQHTRSGNPQSDLAQWTNDNLGSPASYNYLLDRALPASADIVVLGSDRLLPDQTFTASELAEQFFERFPDGFGVMQPAHESDFNPGLISCTSPFIGRGWIERAYGGYGAMHTRYAHYFADFELYWVAQSLGALWDRLDIVHTTQSESFEDRDIFTHYFGSDLALLRQRLRLGFPGSAPAGQAGTINTHVFAEAQHALSNFLDQSGVSRKSA